MEHPNLKRELCIVEDLSRTVFENPQIAVEQIEQQYRDHVRHMSEEAVASGSHIILLCGPSSSGKTTTANRLIADLAMLGREAVRISLDDFYRNRADMPLWEDGRKNFESIEGLDLDCLHRCVNELMTTGHADFPIFDFTTGTRSEQVHPMEYDDHTLLVFEGIHALHPQLREGLAESFGIYIHPNTNYVHADGTLQLDACDLRLTRRMIRDSLNRGTPPLGTLQLWQDVLRGEVLYMLPNCHHADVFVNTSHPYEPFLYCDTILSLLKDLGTEAGEYRETIDRLIASYEPFFSISTDLIPEDSLIQEFIRKQ